MHFESFDIFDKTLFINLNDPFALKVILNHLFFTLPWNNAIENSNGYLVNEVKLVLNDGNICYAKFKTTNQFLLLSF